MVLQSYLNKKNYTNYQVATLFVVTKKTGCGIKFKNTLSCV